MGLVDRTYRQGYISDYLQKLLSEGALNIDDAERFSPLPARQ